MLRCAVAGFGVLLACLALAPAARAEPPGLVAHWRLDDADASGVTLDSSTNGLHAGRTGAPPAVADGRFGGAFQFLARQDSFVADSPLLQPPEVTLAAWVRSPTVLPTVKAIVGQGANGSCSNASYSLYTGGAAGPAGLRFYIWRGTGAFTSPVADNAIWDGSWHHAAGTYDGAAVRLFVDGVEVGTGTPAMGPIVYGLANNDLFAIGNYSGNLVAGQEECIENTSFGGDIDEVRVFNRALTQAEIGELVSRNGVDPPPPPPPPPPPAGPLADRDADGVADGADNCPDRANLTQQDADGDGLGDVCDQLPPGNLAPVTGVRVVTELVSGEVLVRLAGSQAFVPLAGVASLPVGAVVDARKGRVALRSAAGRRGRLGSAELAAGIFQIRQARARRRARVSTDFVLRTPPGRARACASRGLPAKGVVRRLSVTAKGVFRTIGAASVARGTDATWTTADRCNGTLTTARRGRVAVRAGHRTVTLRSGDSYLARAKLFGAKLRRRSG